MAIGEQMMMAATEAVSVFTELYDGASVSCGPLYIRDGHSAVLDCTATKNRIIVMTMESKPGEFAIAVANKEADEDVKHEVLPESQLTTSTLLTYMEAHFAK
ncbi:hypothetical protein EJ576_08840 [Pseudomonas sp. C 49-2]|uniref:hypothetical protein n=1 Tax=unclassified Pseudomonas TaxID=196821 RepID=UPI000F841AAB|nr:MULTISPECIES: hypothetical protein [unclassified Pseudomonas]QZP22833.1 hypothetical protein K5K89_08940 [Pseudomonas sp. DR208]RTY01689.1 hypothetical protein EJ576_08840 [Pseudomonas sp. C 49-2]